jgi:anaerobic selenocysteine-containing dehydrogenase
LEHTRLLLNFGASYYEAEQWARWLDHASTDARARGMKMISIEPRLSQTGAKAAQWIPIRPGTDVVMLLAMAKTLIDEGLIDEEFLLTYTNSPQLVAADGHILVDDTSGEPLVWDTVTEKAVVLADGVVPALTGTYGASKARTALQVLIDSLADATPEQAEAVTGVSAETIRALAREFGRSAMIGSTVVIDGHPIRYRPVAIHSFRGLAAKEYGVQNWRSAQIVMMLVGAQDAVGGLLVHDVYKDPKYFEPSKCEYPPNRVDLQESVYFPHATHNVCQQVAHTLLDPKAYGLPYTPEMQIIYATNRVFSTSDAKKQLEGFATMYNVVIDLVLTETASLADIVLPDLSYLESWHYAPTRWTPNSSHKAIRQPLVNAYDIPYDAWATMWELAKRVGFQKEYVEGMNKQWKNKTIMFDPAKEYTKGAGKPRMKLYADQLVQSYNQVEKTVKANNITNIDLAQFKVAYVAAAVEGACVPDAAPRSRGFPALSDHPQTHVSQSGRQYRAEPDPECAGRRYPGELHRRQYGDRQGSGHTRRRHGDRGKPCRHRQGQGQADRGHPSRHHRRVLQLRPLEPGISRIRRRRAPGSTRPWNCIRTASPA